MSKVKEIYTEIEVLYAAGVSCSEIAKRLKVPLDLVNEIADYLDQESYSYDMDHGLDRVTVG